MTDLLADTTALDCAYLMALVAGLAWAAFVAISGHMGGDVDVGSGPDGDIDLGAGDLDVSDGGASPLSPITISTFVTAFGALGIVARYLFALSAIPSLVMAAVGGLVLAAAMFLFFSRFLIGSQGSSEVRVGHLVGLVGEVVTPIAAGGIGEIAIVAQGARSTYPARSSDGEAISRGTLVTIDRMLGTQALVSPKR